MTKTNPYRFVFGLVVVLLLFRETRAWTCSPRPFEARPLATTKGWSTARTTTPSMERWFDRNHRHRYSNERIITSHLRESSSSSSSSPLTTEPGDDAVVSKARSVIRSLIRSIRHFFRRLLWPGLDDTNFDSSLGARLPEIAPLGCPFFGNNILAGSNTKGPEWFYSETSAKLGHPSIWRFYFMGKPITAVSGSKNINAVLKSKKFDTMLLDFSNDKSETKTTKKKKRAHLFSTNSVMFENDRKKHRFLRRVMGAAFTPSAIQDGTAKVVNAARDQLRRGVKNGETVEMEEVCENFTLDIAWRQMLGLDLKDDDEIQRFHKALYVYIRGIFGIEAYLNFPGMSLFPSFRARRYLVSKIEDRVAYLEENGPDGSTLSAMVFTSDDDSNQKLTREEIVENALILLFAGTETTASTLTSAVFLIGLHPDVFEKMVQEQRELMSAHGATTITREALENCTYLDAVIYETMRMSPVSGGNVRIAREAMVLDGKQVPKGGAVFPNIRLTHELDPKITSSTSLDPLDDFVPDRWLDTETKPMEDFFPFGAGARRCLGAPLAMAEMRVFLSLLARRVDSFELVGEGSDRNKAIRWNPSSIIRKPLGGVPICPTTTNN